MLFEDKSTLSSFCFYCGILEVFCTSLLNFAVFKTLVWFCLCNFFLPQELRDRIKPYFLRRLKSEVFAESEETESRKLSKKHELIVWLRLTQCQVIIFSLHVYLLMQLWMIHTFWRSDIIIIDLCFNEWCFYNSSTNV